jgi:hypothetical protein
MAVAMRIAAVAIVVATAVATVAATVAAMVVVVMVVATVATAATAAATAVAAVMPPKRLRLLRLHLRLRRLRPPVPRKPDDAWLVRVDVCGVGGKFDELIRAAGQDSARTSHGDQSRISF